MEEPYKTVLLKPGKEKTINSKLDKKPSSLEPKLTVKLN
jgi:hypothetical protein